MFFFFKPTYLLFQEESELTGKYFLKSKVINVKVIKKGRKPDNVH